MIGNILLNVRYLLAPVLIIVAGAGVLIGGIMSWLGVVLLFVGLLVDIATKFESTGVGYNKDCLLYTSPSPRDSDSSRMPSSA